MEKSAPESRAPTSETVTVRSRRPREYLTEREIDKLMDAARRNRWGHRDATAIFIAYRHGLRASEVVGLRWDDVDLQGGKLHVRRSKDGATTVHPAHRQGTQGANVRASPGAGPACRQCTVRRSGSAASASANGRPPLSSRFRARCQAASARTMSCSTSAIDGIAT